MIVFFKTELFKEFVTPKRLSEDLYKFYLSDYLLDQLREFYTALEKKQFFSSSIKPIKSGLRCEPGFPICYTELEVSKQKNRKAIRVFKCSDIFRNFKADYFTVKTINPNESMKERKCLVLESPPRSEEDLLIERQNHICSCRNENKKKLLALKRTDFLKEISNNTLKIQQNKAGQVGPSFYSPSYQKSTQDFSISKVRKYSTGIMNQQNSVIKRSNTHNLDSSESWHGAQQEDDPFDYRKDQYNLEFQSEYNIDNIEEDDDGDCMLEENSNARR